MSITQIVRINRIFCLPMSGFCVYIFALNCVCLELNWIYECMQWDCVTDSLDGNIWFHHKNKIFTLNINKIMRKYYIKKTSLFLVTKFQRKKHVINKSIFTRFTELHRHCSVLLFNFLWISKIFVPVTVARKMRIQCIFACISYFIRI